jgi:hypothetical protein
MRSAMALGSSGPTDSQLVLGHSMSVCLSRAQVTPDLKRVVIGGSAAPRSMMKRFYEQFGAVPQHAWGGATFHFALPASAYSPAPCVCFRRCRHDRDKSARCRVEPAAEARCGSPPLLQRLHSPPTCLLSEGS